MVVESPPQGEPFVVGVKSPDAALAEVKVPLKLMSMLLPDVVKVTVEPVMGAGVVKSIFMVPVTVQLEPRISNSVDTLVRRC